MDYLARCHKENQGVVLWQLLQDELPQTELELTDACPHIIPSLMRKVAPWRAKASPIMHESSFVAKTGLDGQATATQMMSEQWAPVPVFVLI
jgi:hypothetical protein